MSDLSALSRVPSWAHYGADEAAGLEGLREAMGPTYEATPADELLDALDEARDYLEASTGRFFVPRVGALQVNGTGIDRLYLPYPLVSESQVVGAGTRVVTVGTEVLEASSYRANEGTGLPGRDPRDLPYLDIDRTTSPLGVWTSGTRNVSISAVWGYLDEDGQTPRLARKVLAALTMRSLVQLDDPDELAELHRGAIESESTRDRSVVYAAGRGGAGLTTDREIDAILSRLRAPAPVRIPQTPRRYGRAWRGLAPRR